mgnify:CR=1 FL=1
MKPSHIVIKGVLFIFILTAILITSYFVYDNNLIAFGLNYALDEKIYLPIIVTPPYSRGYELVFASNQDGDFDLYTMNPDGTDVTKLVDLIGNEDEPDWSPDGKRIVFTKNGSSICILEVSTTSIHCLSPGFSPDFSPDGSKIVFSDGPSGHVEIFVMNSDGSSRIQLTDNYYYSSLYPKWSPDGGKIVYDYHHNLWIMNSDGTEKTRITNNYSTQWAFSASWSPDGNKLAFVYVAEEDYEIVEWGIFTIDTDGTNLMQVTDVFYDDEPEWSPDGQKIIFMSNQDGYKFDDYSYDIYMINPDGSFQTRLTSSINDEWSPDWNPAVTYDLDNPRGDIAFRRAYSSKAKIYTIKADGTYLTALYPLVNVFPGSYAWSNNGEKIAFEGGIGRNGDAPRYLYIMNADGTNLRKIIQLTPISRFFSGSDFSWSPDDSKIVFNKFEDSSLSEIYVINVDGTELKQLTNLNHNSVYPSWSPDGSLIGFFSNDSGGTYGNLFTINPDGTNLTQITSDYEVDVRGWSWSPDGTEIAYISNIGTGYSLYKINKDGSGKTEIFSTPDMPIYNFDWSSDGERIAFSGDVGSGTDIFVINSDGSNLIRLTYDSCWFPSWSWDNSKIAYESSSTRDIFIMNDDGSGKVNISNSYFYMEEMPKWRNEK